MKAQRDNITTGSAGVFHVAAALSMRGIITTITLRNARGIDLLASDGSKSVMIQVKTSSRKSREWQIDKRAEQENSDDLFYFFVDLGTENEIPDFYIVPSNDVADYCKSSREAWIQQATGETRIKRETYSTTKFRDKNGQYLNQWKALGLSFCH